MEEIKVFYKELELKEGDIYSIVSKRVSVGNEDNDYYSYVSDEIYMIVHKDGAIFFSDGCGEGHIYIYPDQLEHLKTVINTAVSRKYALE